jgi:hypothetical protein
MNGLKTVAGIGLALMLTFAPLVVLCQSVPKAVAAATDAYRPAGRTHDSASMMDHNLSREIKQAWSEGKSANLAMLFQETEENSTGRRQGKKARRFSVCQAGTREAPAEKYPL